MNNLEKIKEALKPLQNIDGVEGCWLEEEEGDIVHVYVFTRNVDYGLDKQILQKSAEIERHFPDVSFEFLPTSQLPSPVAEAVF